MADNNESADNSIFEGYDSIQSKAVSFKIIKMYSERPHLWNPQDSNYRVASMKLKSWQEIADELGIDVTTIRKKVNSLLASHRREVSKIKKGKKSNWFLYEAMNFMPSHIDNNNDTTITVNSDHSDTEFVHGVDEESNYDEVEEIQYEEEDSDLVKYFNVPPHEIIVKEESAVQTMPKPKKMRMIYVRQDKLQPKTKFAPDPMEMSESYSEQTHEIVHPIENIVYDSPNKDGKDECDVFGEYIAKTLKKHSDKTRAMIKQAINNVIYEEEMRKYDTDSQVGSSRNN